MVACVRIWMVNVTIDAYVINYASWRLRIRLYVTVYSAGMQSDPSHTSL